MFQLDLEKIEFPILILNGFEAKIKPTLYSIKV